MRLKIQTFINNEFRISVQSDNPKPKKVSDSASVRRNTKYAQAMQENLYSNLAIRKLYQDSNETIKEKVCEITQGNLFTPPNFVRTDYREKKVLPSTFLAVTTTPEGRHIVTKEPTQKLLDRFGRSLDIISESQEQPKKHSSYGEKQTPKQFTKTARHRLLEAGAAIDLLGLKDSSSLLTLTLPGGTEEAKDALARWSGWIVNRQTQVLRDNSRFKGVYWFFVWEWQDRGALHQHWCVSAPDYETAKAASLLIKSMWYQCLDEIGFREGIDMYMRAGYMHSWKNYPKMWVWNEQKVQKSVGSYFAKYASKEYANPSEKRRVGNRRRYFPSRWYGSSNNIKKFCARYRVEFSLHNITKIEADKLSKYLIAELEKYTITQRFAYEFEAIIKTNKWRVTYRKETDRQTGELNQNYELKSQRQTEQSLACYGRTEILYISPLEFVGAFDSFVSRFDSSNSSVYSPLSLYFKLSQVRAETDPWLSHPAFVQPLYGRQNVVC